MYSTDHDSKHASEMDNTTELQHMQTPNPIDTKNQKCFINQYYGNPEGLQGVKLVLICSK
jgi:hypothetical protein